MNPTLIHSLDGSPTLRHANGETYHSTNGAVQESQHVFINAGLLPLLKTKNTIRILEVGFGTGLNALLTLFSAQETGRDIFYATYEPGPIGMDVVKNLNYPPPHPNPLPEGERLFNALHSCSWNQIHSLYQNFFFIKHREKFEDAPLTEKFDLVYFDAFSPKTQSELWTEDVFQKIFNAMTTDAAFVTYCAKGDVKRRLRKIGFVVESLKGAPGKREMLRAIKKVDTVKNTQALP